MGRKKEEDHQRGGKIILTKRDWNRIKDLIELIADDDDDMSHIQ